MDSDILLMVINFVIIVKGIPNNDYYAHETPLILVNIILHES
jgi:hypothetical protein